MGPLCTEQQLTAFWVAGTWHLYTICTEPCQQKTAINCTFSGHKDTSPHSEVWMQDSDRNLGQGSIETARVMQRVSTRCLGGAVVSHLVQAGKVNFSKLHCSEINLPENRLLHFLRRKVREMS